MSTQPVSSYIRAFAHEFGSKQKNGGPTCVWLGAQVVAKTAKFGFYFMAIGFGLTLRQSFNVKLLVSSVILLGTLFARRVERKALAILALQGAVTELPIIVKAKAKPEITAQTGTFYNSFVVLNKEHPKIIVYALGVNSLRTAKTFLATATIFYALHDILNLQWSIKFYGWGANNESFRIANAEIKQNARKAQAVMASVFEGPHLGQIDSLFEKVLGGSPLLSPEENPITVCIFDKLIDPIAQKQ